MAPPKTEVADIIAAYYSFIYPERMKGTNKTHVHGRGGSKGGQGGPVKFLPPMVPHLRKFSAKVIKLRIAKQR